MYLINAQFKSYCFETKQPIAKGEQCLFCPKLKKVFHRDSPSARCWEQEQEAAQLQEKKEKSLSEKLAYAQQQSIIYSFVY